MRGIHPSPRTLPELGENLRVLTPLVEDEALRVEFRPGHGTLSAGAAAAVYDATTALGYVSFANGAASVWALTARAKEPWQKSAVRWSIWYTSPVGSVATFSVQLGARPFGEGMNYAALANSFISTEALTGPTAANDILKHVYVNTGAVLHAFRPWWSFFLARLDPDANANELRILSALVEVLPL